MDRSESGRVRPDATFAADPGLQNTKAQLEKTARNMLGAIRVTGVGEAAFTQRQGGGSFLNVYSHGYGIEVIASLVTSPLDVEKSAAKTALTRL